VKCIAAALCYDIDIRAGISAVRRVKLAGLYLEFLDRIGIWNRYAAAKAAACLKIVTLYAV